MEEVSYFHKSFGIMFTLNWIISQWNLVRNNIVSIRPSVSVVVFYGGFKRLWFFHRSVQLVCGIFSWWGLSLNYFIKGGTDTTSDTMQSCIYRTWYFEKCRVGWKLGTVAMDMLVYTNNTLARGCCLTIFCFMKIDIFWYILWISSKTVCTIIISNTEVSTSTISTLFLYYHPIQNILNNQYTNMDQYQ